MKTNLTLNPIQQLNYFEIYLFSQRGIQINNQDLVMWNFLAINRTYFKSTFINLIPLELLATSQHFLLILRYYFVVHYYIQQLFILLKTVLILFVLLLFICLIQRISVNQTCNLVIYNLKKILLNIISLNTFCSFFFIISKKRQKQQMMKNSQDDAFKIKPQHFSYIKSQMEILTQSVLKITEGPNQMIALLGGTGSGKSTIISILLGAKLKFQKASLGEWKIDHNDTTGKYPKIGHENQSCTTVPVAFLTNSKTYIDLAGWFDTRTPIQQILNAISTSQVFTPRKQLKILIVVSSSQYKALRGGVLINVANRLMECFKEDFLHIVHSIILIMTKVDTDDWEIEDVKKQLIKICKKNQNLKGHTKHFLQILVKEQRILFLPIPKKNQEFKKHVQYIQKQIQQVRWSTLINQAQISLSTEAKLAVNDCILDLNKDLNNTAQKIGSQIQKQCGKKKFKNGKQANDALNQLILSNQILMKQISQVLTFKQLEQKLDQLVKRLPVNKLIAGELKKNFNMINFYKQISTETKISQDFMKIISVSLQKSILKVQKDRDNLASKQQIQQMKKDFLIEMDKRAKQEKKQRQKVQSQLQNKMKEQQDKIIKQKEEHDKQMNQLEPKLRKQLQDQIKNQRMKAQELQKLNQKKNFWSNFGTVVGTIKMVSDMYSLYKTGQSLNSSFLQKSFDKSSNLNQPISSKFMQTFVKQSTKKFQELKKLK